jgi:hypothetical protein
VVPGLVDCLIQTVVQEVVDREKFGRHRGKRTRVVDDGDGDERTGIIDADNRYDETVTLRKETC